MYSRANVVKALLGSNYKVAVVSMTSGVTDADSRGSFYITSKDPVQQSYSRVPQWAYQLAALLPYGDVVETFTNGTYAGVDHINSSSTKQAVEAYHGNGLTVSQVDAPTSKVHSKVEEWAASKGSATGFTGMFLYDIGNSSFTNYKIRAFANVTYKVSSNDFWTSFPVRSSNATAVHYVNTP